MDNIIIFIGKSTQDITSNVNKWTYQNFLEKKFIEMKESKLSFTNDMLFVLTITYQIQKLK